MVFILKHLALLTLLAGLLPVSIVFHHKIMSEISIHKIMINSSFILIGGYLGFFCSKIYGKLINNHNHNLFKKIFVGFLCYLVTFCFLLGFILLAYHGDIKTLISVGIISIASYIVLLKNEALFYSDILDRSRYAILTGICTSCMFLVPIPWITVIFFAITASYVIIENQSIVDKMLKRTSKNTVMVTDIRSYNIFLVTLFFILFCLGYGLRKYIIIIIKSILILIKVIVIAIINILYWLLNSNNLEDLNEIEDYSSPFLEAEASNLADNFFVAVITLVFIFIIIRFRWGFYDVALKLLKDTKSFFINLLKIKISNENTNQSYYDQVESVIPRKIKKKDKVNKSANKLWKREYRNFLKVTDITKKYRLGYKLIIEWYKLKRVKIIPSDTTLEICEKTSEYKEIDPIDDITKTYNEIRYGDSEAEEKDIERIIQTIDKQYKQFN